MAQLREPGPARGLQGPGAGRLPAQRGGERASLRPHAPARTGISSHQGTTASSPRPAQGGPRAAQSLAPPAPFLTEVGALEAGGWGVGAL